MAQQRVPVDVRRRQLVEVALLIAERDGPAAVTARRLAAEANVSLGLVHYCFTTTQELGAHMAARMTEQLGEAALPLVVATSSATDVRAILGAAIDAMWSQIEATRRRQLLTYELATYVLRNPQLEATARQQYETADRVVLDLLEAMSARAGISWTLDVGELVRLIVLAIDGATLRWLSDGDSAQAKTSLSHVADLVASAAIPAH